MSHKVAFLGSVLGFFMLFSCVNRGKVEEAEVTNVIDSIPDADSSNLGPIWTYDYDADAVKYIDSAGAGARSIGELVDIVNDRYRNKVDLHFEKQQGDTVFVKIDSANYLTKQMGSAGARDFMAVTTFTLTEADNVHYVFFDFIEGDHASPGVYSRASFRKK
jgi:hypothetical protein